MRNKLDLTGRKFGKLTVLRKLLPLDNCKKYTYWICMCACGNLKNVQTSHLTSNAIISCGCYRKEIHSHNDIKSVKLASASYVYRQHYNDGNLTFEQFLELSQQNCYYCNSDATTSINIFNRFKNLINIDLPASTFSVIHGDFVYNGLDRINSKLLHNINNVVPCCRTCNSFKNNLLINNFISNILNLRYAPRLLTADKLSTIQRKLRAANLTTISQLFLIKNNSGTNLCVRTRNNIKNNAKNKKIPLVFELNNHQIDELMCAPCSYCGKQANPEIGKFNGIDRIDNSVGYTIANSVACCRYCNWGKHTLSFADFLLWIRKIKKYLPSLKEKIKMDPKFSNYKDK